MLDSLELELQDVVSHPVWVPGTKLRSLERAVLTLAEASSLPPSSSFKLPFLERTWKRVPAFSIAFLISLFCVFVLPSSCFAPLFIYSFRFVNFLVHRTQKSKHHHPPHCCHPDPDFSLWPTCFICTLNDIRLSTVNFQCVSLQTSLKHTPIS